MTGALIGTAVQIIVGWVLIVKVPEWLGIRGFFATVLKIIGVLVIISAVLSWI